MLESFSRVEEPLGSIACVQIASDDIPISGAFWVLKDVVLALCLCLVFRLDSSLLAALLARASRWDVAVAVVTTRVRIDFLWRVCLLP